MEDKFFDYEVNPSDSVWDGVQARTPTDGGMAKLFSNYEVTPARGVWRGIANNLHPQRRRAIGWWSVAAAVLILASTWVLTTDSERNFASTVNPGQNTTGIVERAVKTTELMDTFKATKDAMHTDFQREVTDSRQSRDGKYESVIALEESLSNVRTMQYLDCLPPALIDVQILPPTWQVVGYIPLPPVVHSREDDWALAASLTPYFSYAPENDYSTTSPTMSTFNDNQDGLSTEELVFNFSDLPTGKNEEVFSPPLSFGMRMVAFNAHRVRAGLGFEYTLLHGEASYHFAENKTLQSFNQHYLGGVLFSELKLFQWNKWSSYLRGGMQYDFGLKSTTKVEDYTGDQLVNAYQFSFKPGNQLSAMGSLGLMHRLNSKFSFYFEGSVRKMIAQQSENLWSQKDYWPSISVGIKMNL